MINDQRHERPTETTIHRYISIEDAIVFCHNTQQKVQLQLKIMSSAQEEARATLASLSRVSHRLAMIDSSSQLESVLDKLLSRLLNRIGTNYTFQQQQQSSHNSSTVHVDIHAKLIDMLSHVMKRVKHDESVQLNCQSLLEVFFHPPDDSNNNKKKKKKTPRSSLDPFSTNLTLAFLSLGVPRCNDSDKVLLLLPDLAQLVAYYQNTSSSSNSKSTWQQLSNLLLTALEKTIVIQEAKLKQLKVTSSKSRQLNQPTAKKPKQDNSGDDDDEEGSSSSSSSKLSSPLSQFQSLLEQDMDSCRAVYELLLDVLLYEPSGGSNVPPPGLSSAGRDRLQAYFTTTTTRTQLVDCKRHMLEWIAPTRQYSLFSSSSSIERAVVLMVVASGDGRLREVAEAASAYLKQHLDSHRQDEDSEKALGSHMDHILGELLTLCVGGAHGASVLGSSGSTDSDISFQRRAIDESIFGAASAFCAKLLDDHTSLLTWMNIDRLGYLAVLAVRKQLTTLQTTSGLTVQRGRPYIAASQLLQSLVIRLSTMVITEKAESNSSSSATMIQSLSVQALHISMAVLKPVSTRATSNSSSSSSVSSEGNIQIRDNLYGVICAFARTTQRSPNSSGGGEKETANFHLELVSLLFGCCSNELDALRPRAMAALDALLASYCRRYVSEVEGTVDESMPVEVATNPWAVQTDNDLKTRNNKATQLKSKQLVSSLFPLLWSVATNNSSSKHSRIAATRWCSELLLQLDLINSCHLLCYIAGDDLYDTVSTMATTALHGTEVIPEFSSWTGLIFNMDSSWSRPSFDKMNPKAKAQTLNFTLRAYQDDLYGDGDSYRLAVHRYLTAVTRDLQSEKCPNVLLNESSRCLSSVLSTSEYARSLFFKTALKEPLPLSISDLQNLSVSVKSIPARKYLSESMGELLTDTEQWRPEMWLESITSCMTPFQAAAAAGLKAHEAAFLAAIAVRALRTLPASKGEYGNSSLIFANEVLQEFSVGLLHHDDIVAGVYRSSLMVSLASGKSSGSNFPHMDPKLHTSTTTALQNLTALLKRYGNQNSDEVTGKLTSLIPTAGVVLAASTSASGLPLLGSARLDCVTALFGLLGSPAYRKDDAIAIIVGEALGLYADACDPEATVWSSRSDSSVWPTSVDEQYANELPPHEQVIFLLLRMAANTSNVHRRTSCAGALLGVIARVTCYAHRDREKTMARSLFKEVTRHLFEIQHVFLDLLGDHKSKQISRESCCLGLAATHSLSLHSTASEGHEELNEKLLRAFGQTTNFGTSAMMETREQAEARRISERSESAANAAGVNSSDPEAQVGGASGLSEASLGAYREMAAVAVSIGRIDILHSLLVLSVSHPFWISSDTKEFYTASALLGKQYDISGEGAENIREALRPHFAKVLPQMLRACHDPNKETRESMEALTNAVTGGAALRRKAISDHFLVILDALLEQQTSKLWRTRFGACSALRDIIVGRSWEDLGGGPAVLDDDDVFIKASPTTVTSAGVRLLRLWYGALRALDDVRSNVREAGLSLARGLSTLTIRMCDPFGSEKDRRLQLSDEETRKHKANASAAAATSLRWLIKKGLNQQFAEAAGICIACLVGIVETAKPAILQPLIPDLLNALLLAMSGLEPAALNYLSVRAAGGESSNSYEEIEQARLQIAQSGPLATAVTKCLEILPYCVIDIQQNTIRTLDSTFRLASGTASRVAVADVIANLTSHCSAAFRFGAPSNMNPSVRLMRSLYFASERERGQASKDRMSHALGSIAALCPGPSVRSLAMRACDRYNAANGNNDDPNTRKAAAVCLRSIAVRASQQFADGNVWCRRILPIAYLGMEDTDDKVASLFREVWEEGGSAATTSLSFDNSSSGSLLEEKLLPYIVNECTHALKDVAWSRRVAAAKALSHLCTRLRVLVPMPCVNTSTEVPKDELTRAMRRVEASRQAISELSLLVANSRLWSGKAEVVKALVALASNWSGSGTSVSVAPGENAMDLLMGDGFYSTRGGEDQNNEVGEDMDDSEIPSPMDVEEKKTSNDEAIDFDSEPAVFKEDEEEGVSEEIEEIAASMDALVFSGLARLLLDQAFPQKVPFADEELLPYRATCLQGFADLLTSLTETEVVNEATIRQQKMWIFEEFGIRLISNYNESSIETKNGVPSLKEPPLVVAKSITCLSSCIWKGMARSDILTSLATCCDPQQPQGAYWTVREAATTALANTIGLIQLESLRELSNIRLIMDCAAKAQKDTKFWKVRLGAVRIISSLVSRTSVEKALLLDAVLPEKESILVFGRKALQDSEPKVSALAAKMIGEMAWWP